MNNIMKKNILWFAALSGAMALAACQKTELEFSGESPATVQGQDAITYGITILAGRNDVTGTKGLAVDGEEDSATLLKSIWKEGEEVKVYLGTDCIGTLTATPDAEDAHNATLSGTVTASGITPGTTTLSLLTPRHVWDYSGQTGALLLSDDATNSIEKNYHYTLATDVLVTDVSDGNITTEEAGFTNQQSIYRLSFRYDNGSSKTAVVAKSMTVSSSNGHLVQSQAVDGSSVVEGPISVVLETASANPFFVALRNIDATQEDEVLAFTVIDADGITYKGSKTIPAEFKANGTFVSVKNATLDERMQLSTSSTEVSTVL